MIFRLLFGENIRGSPHDAGRLRDAYGALHDKGDVCVNKWNLSPGDLTANPPDGELGSSPEFPNVVCFFWTEYFWGRILSVQTQDSSPLAAGCAVGYCDLHCSCLD